MALLSDAQIRRVQRKVPEVLPSDVTGWVLVAFKNEVSPSGTPIRMHVTASTNNTLVIQRTLEMAVELSKDRGALMAVSLDPDEEIT